jgi:hypothetical protein
LYGALPELLRCSRKRAERCGNAENFRFRFRSEAQKLYSLASRVNG